MNVTPAAPGDALRSRRGAAHLTVGVGVAHALLFVLS